MFKKLIRSLYWRFAHKGDAWEARIVCYYLGKMIKTDGEVPSGRYILAQFEENMNKALAPGSISLKEVAGFHIGELP